MTTRPKRSTLEDDSPALPARPKRSAFDDLRSKIRLNRNAVDDDLEEHADLVFEVNTGHAFAMSKRDGQKEYLKRIENRIAARARDSMGGKGSLADVARVMEEDPEWIKERDKYLDLCAEVDHWGALREAYIARGFALHNLAAYAISQMKAEGGSVVYGGDSDVRDRRREVTERRRADSGRDS
jgi:hypothetical protein